MVVASAALAGSEKFGAERCDARYCTVPWASESRVTSWLRVQILNSVKHLSLSAALTPLCGRGWGPRSLFTDSLCTSPSPDLDGSRAHQLE